MSVAGNFLMAALRAAISPVTIANSNPSYAFLAKISGTATSPFTSSTPTSINFGSQPVGVSTTVTGSFRRCHGSQHQLYAGTISSIPHCVSILDVSRQSDS